METLRDRLERMKAAAALDGIERVVEPTGKYLPHGRMEKYKKQAEETVTQELLRIARLPIRQSLTDAEIDALSAHYFQRQAYLDGWRLYREQAESLVEYSKVDGGFLPLAVGGGKTLTSLLIANDAYHAGLDTVMILVPSALALQLVETDIKHWRPLTIFNMPIHNLYGASKHKRDLLSMSNRKGLYIFTHDLLSRDHEVLEHVKPKLIIADEAHGLAKQSARSRRFNNYLHTNSPQLVALSGTMTQKALTDYFELSRAALGRGNFLPNSKSLTEEWSKMIDVSASSLGDFNRDNVPKAGPLRYLVDWARTNFKDEKFEHSVVGFRKVFERRLMTTPGVVTSSGDNLPYSLYMHNDPVKNPEQCKGFLKMRELVDKLTNEWLTPNGDEIEEAMHLFRWRYWIEGAGFYTELYWPTVERMMDKGKYMNTAHAEQILELSMEYHALNMDYARELRAWIKENAVNGLDTPMLIGKSMSLYGDKQVSSSLYSTWKAWKGSEFEGRIERLKRAVRVCPFKVDKAVNWAKSLPKDEGCLIWYDNDEMGDWVYEQMQEADLNPLLCKAGPQYNKILNNKDECKGRKIVLTINAHYQGKNLQFDRNQFYLQWPRPASRAEQAIGRQHRNGQEYDEVHVTTCNTFEFDHVMFAATLNDAAYVHQSQGNKQKLIYATYTTKPKIIPFEVLQQWGAEPKQLSAEAKRLLERTFGD